MVAFLSVLAVLFGASFLLRHRANLSRERRVVVGAGLVALVIVAVATAPSGLVLQKALARLIMPLGLLWLALLLLSLQRFHRGEASGAAVAFAVFTALGVVGNEHLAERGLLALEAPHRADPLSASARAAPPFDAVIVLGGGAKRGPVDDSYELGTSGDRVALGVRLFVSGRTPLLVTTGSPIEGFGKPFDSVAATETLWRDLGVPASAIVGVTGARNTREEAQALAALVKERGWTRVGLVTSAWHMRRALGLFANHGITPIALAADHRGDPVWSGAVSVVPTGNGAFLWNTLAWELLGALVGR